MECPKCASEMESQLVGEIMIDRCTGCRGVWLDAREAERIRSAADAVAGIERGASPSTGRASKADTSLDDVGPIQCPRCGTRMILLVVESRPPLHFEHCGGCNGVFLDRGELLAMTEIDLEQWLRATIPGVFRLRLPPA